MIRLWRKLFKKKNPISNLAVGVKITTCKDCSRFNIGTEIHDLFSWGSSNFGAIGYDKETKEILLAEEQIMRIIQMVNPAQAARKIKLVSQEEIWKSVG